MKTVDRFHHFLIAGLILAIVESTPKAASRLTEDLTEILKIAHAVVEVKVTHEHAYVGRAHGLAITLVNMRVEKVYKGELVSTDQIEAEIIGGKIDGRTVIAPGQAQLNVGDRAVLMLYKAPNSSNWRVLGGDAGHIVLTTNSDGYEIARRGSGQFEFFVSDQSSITGFRPVKGTAIRAEQLGALLQAVLETGRPVIKNPPTVIDSPQSSVATRAIIHPSISTDDSTGLRLMLVVFVTTLIWVRANRTNKAAKSNCSLPNSLRSKSVEEALFDPGKMSKQSDSGINGTAFNRPLSPMNRP